MELIDYLRVVGAPHTFGWLRRPDLDTKTGNAWELPDGKLFMFPKHLRWPKVERMVAQWPKQGEDAE